MSTLDQQIKSLRSETSTDDFVRLIDVLKVTDQKFNVLLLVDLLSERHIIYKDRSSLSSQRMRAYLIEAFHHIGLPQRGLPYILEELETSFYPYTVAAAARAIRGMKEPHSGVAGFLCKSIYNIWQGDITVNYSAYAAPFNEEENTSALKEIFETLKWQQGTAQYVLPELYHIESNLSDYINAKNKALLADCIVAIEASAQPDDDCCSIPLEIYNQRDSSQNANTDIDLSDIDLEDQNGTVFKWNEYFSGKYTILSFFYTQCHNPRKCIQTIYNLVDIQKEIDQNKDYSHIQTAAITYDPLYDTSSILKSYGENRKFNFDDHNKMFRVTSGMEEMIEQLNIGVNYKGNAVNVHRIEVYIINPEGKIECSFLRFQADSKLILAELDKVIHPEKKKETVVEKPSVLNRTSTVILPILIAFFPKCPMCWAAYLNLIGLSSIVSIKHQPWLIYVFIGFAVFNLINLYRLSKRRNGLLPFHLALIGTSILGLNYWLGLHSSLLILGISLTLLATLLNSLSFKLYHKLFYYLREQIVRHRYS